MDEIAPTSLVAATVKTTTAETSAALSVPATVETSTAKICVAAIAPTSLVVATVKTSTAETSEASSVCARDCGDLDG